LPALRGDMVDVKVCRRLGARTVNLLERDGASKHVLVVLLREKVTVVNEDDSVCVWHV
jgi:hypothetical protein